MLPGLLPAWVLWVSLVDLLAGLGLTIYVGAFRTLRSPFYWLLHSAAAYTALWRLVTRPHYRAGPRPGRPRGAPPPPPARIPEPAGGRRSVRDRRGRGELRRVVVRAQLAE